MREAAAERKRREAAASAAAEVAEKEEDPTNLEGSVICISVPKARHLHQASDETSSLYAQVEYHTEIQHTSALQVRGQH